ncbi:MAG TPA: hypothetical protein PKA64_21585, partial [Myxococcota bacterium]|nr:hypothetical protein [Myxococcota bacterium]
LRFRERAGVRPGEPRVGPCSSLLEVSLGGVVSSPLGAVTLLTAWVFYYLGGQRSRHRAALVAQRGVGFDEEARHAGVWWGRIRLASRLAAAVERGRPVAVGGAKRTGKTLTIEALVAAWMAELGSAEELDRWPVPPRVLPGVGRWALVRLGLARLRLPVRVTTLRVQDDHLTARRKISEALRAVLARLGRDRLVARRIGELGREIAKEAAPARGDLAAWDADLVATLRRLRERRVEVVFVVEEISSLLGIGPMGEREGWRALRALQGDGVTLLVEGARCERDEALRRWLRSVDGVCEALDHPLEPAVLPFTSVPLIPHAWTTFTFFGSLSRYASVRPTWHRRRIIWAACRGQPFLLQYVCARVLGNRVRAVAEPADLAAFSGLVDAAVRDGLEVLQQRADWMEDDRALWGFPSMSGRGTGAG